MSILVGGMCSICCHNMALVLSFMHLCSVFNLQLFLFILFYIFKKSGIETPDRNGQWYQHLLILFAILYESNTEGTNFRIMFICFTFVKCACFVLYTPKGGRGASDVFPPCLESQAGCQFDPTFLYLLSCSST